MIKDKVFELSGPSNSIATKIGQDGDCKNCMMVGRVMGAGTGKHTISMKLAQGRARYMNIYCSVVRDGAACNGDLAEQDSTVGWFMLSAAGSLSANGKSMPAGLERSSQARF